MDKAKIDAMRTVVEIASKCSECAGGQGCDFVNTIDGPVPALTFKLAAEGLRTLVDEAAAKAEPAKPAEPTLEECVAAMNRADYLGASDWMLTVASPGIDTNMGVGSAELVGSWLIERERADAAKGGA